MIGITQGKGASEDFQRSPGQPLVDESIDQCILFSSGHRFQQPTLEQYSDRQKCQKPRGATRFQRRMEWARFFQCSDELGAQRLDGKGLLDGGFQRRGIVSGEVDLLRVYAPILEALFFIFSTGDLE